MRRVPIAIFVTLLSFTMFQAQTPTEPPSAEAGPDPTFLGQEWVDQLNRIFDWHITMDGREEGIDEGVDAFLELLAPDVLVEVPPHDEKQIGPVMLIGTRPVRQWATKLARTYVEVVYSLQRQTEQEFEGQRMVYAKQLSWGGMGISFPIFVDYSTRTDRRRFLEVGAVFIQYGEDGKIQRFRLFQSEKEEVLAD